MKELNSEKVPQVYLQKNADFVNLILVCIFYGLFHNRR